MNDRKYFIAKGGRIKKGDSVKAIDCETGVEEFYRVESVWGAPTP